MNACMVPLLAPYRILWAVWLAFFRLEATC